MTKLLINTTEVLTIVETMAALGVGYATLYRWLKIGKITAIRFSGRTFIPKSEIERLQKGVK